MSLLAAAAPAPPGSIDLDLGIVGEEEEAAPSAEGATAGGAGGLPDAGSGGGKGGKLQRLQASARLATICLPRLVPAFPASPGQPRPLLCLLGQLASEGLNAALPRNYLIFLHVPPLQSILDRLMEGSHAAGGPARQAFGAATTATGAPPHQAYCLGALEGLIEKATAYTQAGRPVHWGWCRWACLVLLGDSGFGNE